MPETMVEKVARAILAKAIEDEGWTYVDNSPQSLEAVTIDGYVDLMSFARAALQALREPTEAMVEAGTIPTREIWLGNGTTATGLGLGADQGSIWRAMIDAALSEGAER